MTVGAALCAGSCNGCVVVPSVCLPRSLAGNLGTRARRLLSPRNPIAASSHELHTILLGPDSCHNAYSRLA